MQEASNLNFFCRVHFFYLLQKRYLSTQKKLFFLSVKNPQKVGAYSFHCTVQRAQLSNIYLQEDTLPSTLCWNNMQSCSIVFEIKCCRYKPNNIEGSFHLGSQDLLDDFKNKTVCHIKPSAPWWFHKIFWTLFNFVHLIQFILLSSHYESHHMSESLHKILELLLRHP